MNPIPDFLLHRNPETSKVDYGHALLVAGAYGKAGCALLAARACMRIGAGLLTVHVPGRCVDIIQTGCPEAMLSVDASPTLFTEVPAHLDRYQAIAVGPGIGTDERSFCALRDLLGHPDCPSTVILDADALNLIALHPSELFPLLPSGTILTPHMREYSRLCAGAETAPADFARVHNATLLLKGHRTLVCAPDGRMDCNHTGNAGMATAGSGDVLTGIMLGLAAQREAYRVDRKRPVDNFELALLSAHLHGKSGDIATQKQAECTIVATDIIENLRFAIC